MRNLITAGISALLCMALVAAPASAKKHSAAEFDYIATIDCGHGKPMVVGSGMDTAEPLVDLKTGRRFLPAEWHLAIGTFAYDEVISPAPAGRRMACSYDDGEATGTVVVVKAAG
jgi:hypothetical protein